MTDRRDSQRGYNTKKNIMSVQFIICLNKQGIVRLLRWFVKLDTSEHTTHQEYIQHVFKVVSQRDHRHQSNFIEFSEHTKLVHKRYAGLYFIMGVDKGDEELIYLSQIHLFVEVLDSFFGNVCELDILFNFYKAYMVMDEMFVAGEIQSTSKQQLLERIGELDKLN